MREVAKRLHNESRSTAELEEMGEAAGIRNHSIGETPEGGRSGGGYVVGNAWAGLGMDEREKTLYQTVS